MRKIDCLESVQITMKFIINENKLSSVYFKANFAIKLQLLKRNSFVLITLNMVDEWLENNIDKFFKRGG